MKFIYNDGGRAASGFIGKCGDCVCRAITIATNQPYGTVYRALADINASYRGRSGSKQRSARNGIVTKGIGFKRYMASLGWTFVPTMGIGTGCLVHLEDGELPMGNLIVSVSKHYCAVIDGVINDTYDPSNRAETIYPPNTAATEMPKNVRPLEDGNGWVYAPKRCVYGYWKKSAGVK